MSKKRRAQAASAIEQREESKLDKVESVLRKWEHVIAVSVLLISFVIIGLLTGFDVGHLPDQGNFLTRASASDTLIGFGRLILFVIGFFVLYSIVLGMLRGETISKAFGFEVSQSVKVIRDLEKQRDQAEGKLEKAERETESGQDIVANQKAMIKARDKRIEELETQLGQYRVEEDQD